MQRQRLGYYESLDGFPALDAAKVLTLPALTRTDGGTIGCQTAQSYTQWVPMHDPDQAQSILPVGQSEWPDSPSRTSTIALWAEGRLHPAPLSREKVKTLIGAPDRAPHGAPTPPSAGPQVSGAAGRPTVVPRGSV